MPFFYSRQGVQAHLLFHDIRRSIGGVSVSSFLWTSEERAERLATALCERWGAVIGSLWPQVLPLVHFLAVDVFSMVAQLQNAPRMAILAIPKARLKRRILAVASYAIPNSIFGDVAAHSQG